MRRDAIAELPFEIVYVGVAFILQSSVVGYLAIGPVRPDLILGSVVYIALSRGRLHSTVAGFLIGLLQDLGFGGALGLSSFCKALMGFSSNWASKLMFKERYWAQVALLAGSVLVHDFFYFMFVLSGNIVDVGLSLFRISLGSALYTALLSPGYDGLMQRVRKVFSEKETAPNETTVFPPE